MPSTPRVLLVNPDPEACRLRATGLLRCGIPADQASSGAHALALLEGQDYAAILTELEPGDMAAEELLESARRRSPHLAVVVWSPCGGAPEAVRLGRLGLDDYWPAARPEEAAAALVELLARRGTARAEAPRSFSAGGAVLISRSPAMQRVVETIRLIAAKRSTVLITGPTGTGKELAARLIHSLSPRAGADLVTVNCGAIPEQLLEAEFFGHVRGAFTGALAARVGRFEQAHGSTLFLDEVGDLPFELQAKVLRAVQEREFQRVGSSQNVQVDVRILAATNADLGEKVQAGAFREDLYYRLNVVPLRLPALAEHLQDVPDLVEHFLERICRAEALAPKRVGPATMERLAQYHWPGNVRQLENAVEKAAVLSGERRDLYPSDFPLPASQPRTPPTSGPAVYLPASGLHLDTLLGGLERSLLEQALTRAGGNKKRAAEFLGLKRTTLSAKLRAAGLRINGG